VPVLLDEKNKKLIDKLQMNPLATQSELAKYLNLTQSAIAMRLSRLLKSGLILREGGINYESLGLKMARLDVETSEIQPLMDWAERCPLFVNASIAIGGKNVAMLFVSEDLQMFYSIADLHIRRIQNTSQVSFSEIISWAKEFLVELDLNPQRTKSPPCGMLPYCPRCPANPEYDGNIWTTI
jgi:DNA-binding Lrp family transcriptional regulator